MRETAVVCLCVFAVPTRKSILRSMTSSPPPETPDGKWAASTTAGIRYGVGTGCARRQTHVPATLATHRETPWAMPAVSLRASCRWRTPSLLSLRSLLRHISCGTPPSFVTCRGSIGARDRPSSACEYCCAAGANVSCARNPVGFIAVWVSSCISLRLAWLLVYTNIHTYCLLDGLLYHIICAVCRSPSVS